MDASINLPNINLLSARFDNIRAEIGEHSKVSGGTLNVTVKTALAKNGVPNQAEGDVYFSVIAFPKGSDSKDKKSFAFKVELAVNGIFEWAKGEEPNLKDDSVDYVLLQSLYIMATTEVISIAQKLGFPGVSLPLDLRLNKALVAPSIPKKASSAKRVRSIAKKE